MPVLPNQWVNQEIDQPDTWENVDGLTRYTLYSDTLVSYDSPFIDYNGQIIPITSTYVNEENVTPNTWGDV